MSNQIQELKEAIVQHDWELCKTLTNRIFQNSDTQSVANLAITYVHLYKGRFVKQYPEQTILIKRLVEIDELMEQEAKDIPIFPDRNIKLKEPLGRTYKSAIDYLWSMAKWRNKSETFSIYACNAILNTITVIRYEYPKWIPNEFADLSKETYDDYTHEVWIEFINRLVSLS